MSLSWGATRVTGGTTLVTEPSMPPILRLVSRTRGCFDRAMSRSEKPKPHLGAQAAHAQAERAAREAAALRENLRKRKAQARDRTDADQLDAKLDIPSMPDAT